MPEEIDQTKNDELIGGIIMLETLKYIGVIYVAIPIFFATAATAIYGAMTFVERKFDKWMKSDED